MLRTLLGEELAGRERSSLATRRAAAAFPTGKTFEAWEPTASSIPAPTPSALRTLEWVRRRENLVVCGPSGTGKTFFLEALGQLCVEAGLKVAWFALEDLGVLVRRHRADDTVSKAVARILRSELIAVDDIGLLPVTTDTAEALYRVVDAAYEKRAIALSSNLHPAGFDELMPKTIANATVDRLLHHAHICVTAGDSVRTPTSHQRQRSGPPSHERPTPHRRNRHRIGQHLGEGQSSTTPGLIPAYAELTAPSSWPSASPELADTTPRRPHRRDRPR